MAEFGLKQLLAKESGRNPPQVQILLTPPFKNNGGLAERSKAAVLKTVEGASPPGVRIPHPPPFSILIF